MAEAFATEEIHRTREERRSAKDVAESRPVAVRVEGLSVRLSLQKEKVTTLRERVIRFLERRPVEIEEFWPVRDVSFTLHKGEAYGVLGHNGAGKSTLLKVIAGVVGPTRGRVEVSGRIAPLLELGAGFDVEMTGRENIFLYGSLLGYPRRKLVDRFDEIVAFAELEEFIDVPLKNYSSGMTARLGFAVATEVDADILIVDEALTVGDSRFQMKCMERIEEFRRGGMSILFVSHNLEQVRWMCSKALWIDNGVVRAQGDVEEVLGAYSTIGMEPDKPASPRPEAAPAALSFLSGRAGDYDFVDVSHHDANSVRYCARRFGGTGLGISRQEETVERYRALGTDARRADVSDVDLPDRSVSYVSVMDALPFFWRPGEVETLLERATSWARDFVFIRMPSFEDEDYLRSVGLAFFWWGWTALPPVRRLADIEEVLDRLGVANYEIVMRQPVLTSDSPLLLPSGAPPDQNAYEQALHGPKPLVIFPRPVHAQFDLFIATREIEPDVWRQIVDSPEPLGGP